jgi:K+ transporter
VLAFAMSDMAGRNFERWPILNTWIWPNTPPMLEATTYMGQTAFVLDYIRDRAQWMADAVNSSRFLIGQFD